MNNLVTLFDSTVRVVDVHAIYAAAIFGIGVFLAWVLTFLERVNADNSHIPALDGLRGCCAFFVFIHHALFWRSYHSSGIWAIPESSFFVFLGKGSVIIFFMITGFLFFGKILRQPGLDWLNLYIGRFFRIFPLYIALILSVLVVLTLLGRGGWVGIRETLIPVLKWVLMLGAPDINGLKDTKLLTAGVTWTLTREWMFYFCLPALALLVWRQRSPVNLFTIFGIAFTLVLATRSSFDYYWGSFLIGMFFAWLRHKFGLMSWVNSRPAKWSVAMLPVILIVSFPNPYNGFAILGLGLFFGLIVMGARIAFLESAPMRLLGDLSYGIYLFHGIILFVLFGGLLKASTKPLENFHWLFIGCLVPILVIICYILHVYVELPGMAYAKVFAEKLKSARTSVMNALTRARI
ncbi:acyltransferase family protein [Aquabacterium soli]|uniref:acyltransferase family protein n=1 Tax=Aquabacterium soli TaxID=2493092 RepID=UPI0013150FBD|nr:acyltransferase [Aquabacterium soli]